MRFILAVLALLLVAGPAQTEPTEDPQLKALRTKEQQLAQRLLRDFPDSVESLVLLGDFYQNRGQTDQALKLWQQVLNKNAGRADVYDRMARVAFATDDYETSSRLWRSALQMNPSLSNLHNNLARSLMQLGQYDRADSLRATLSDRQSEQAAFSQLLRLVEQGIETGRPDLAYQTGCPD